MYWVYALKSEQHNWIYVGMTNNLERRISEHNNGKSNATRPYKPFVLIYKEQYSTRKTARTKEKYYKSTSGKRFLKTLI